MKITDELRQVVALNLVAELGPVKLKNLLTVFGNVAAIFGASVRELAQVKGVSNARAEAIKDLDLFGRAEKEIKNASDHGAEIISLFDKRYPKALKEIYDPPILLYVKGMLPVEETPAVAVVGTRMCSPYGQRIATGISRELAQAGVVIVSGLALGIDTAAHEGALEGGGVTVAVLGGGLNSLYPSENRKLAEEIVKKGAVITEYPMDMAPQPGYFPVRNRIISGLSRAVLVVEARAKSGALITADAALEQGRDVFAVPGNADSARSQGTNALLKQGAKFVTSAEDILEELGIKGGCHPRVSGDQSEQGFDSRFRGNDAEAKILALLDGEPLHADALIEESGLPAKSALSALSMMEIKGWVKQLPGKNFIKAI